MTNPTTSVSTALTKIQLEDTDQAGKLFRNLLNKGENAALVRATIHENPRTALMALAKGDTALGNLTTKQSADVLEVVDKEDGAITNGVNEMWIKYFDPISKQTGSVALQALGSVQSQGVVSWKQTGQRAASRSRACARRSAAAWRMSASRSRTGAW